MVDSDLARIGALFYETVRRVNIRDYSAEQVEAWIPHAPEADHLRRRFAELTVWVAERDGEIAGFCGLGAGGYLDLLYVDWRFQRQGIARRLYETAEAEARRQRAAYLHTHASITARPFFESMGFVAVRSQEVEIRGVRLRNFVMEKNLAWSVEKSRR